MTRVHTETAIRECAKARFCIAQETEWRQDWARSDAYRGAERTAKMLAVKSAILTITLVVALALTFLLVRYFKTGDSLDPNKEPFSITLERDAAQLNATLPEIVSEGVRLDKATAGPGNSFHYSYTIVDDDTARDIAGSVNKINELETQLHERVCSTMPEYRENGTLVNYLIKNNAGVIIADISINPKDC